MVFQNIFMLLVFNAVTRYTYLCRGYNFCIYIMLVNLIKNNVHLLIVCKWMVVSIADA